MFDDALTWLKRETIFYPEALSLVEKSYSVLHIRITLAALFWNLNWPKVVSKQKTQTMVVIIKIITVRSVSVFPQRYNYLTLK